MKIVVCPCLVFLCLSLAAASRNKRFLLVPPTAPTRHQWIAGIGIPLDLENIAVTTGYVLKAQYFLPTAIEHLYPFNSWEGLEDLQMDRLRRDVMDNEIELVDNSTGTKYSTYNVPAIIIEEAPNGNKTNAEEENDEDYSDYDSELKADSEAAKAFWDGLYDKSEDAPDNSRWDAYKALEGVSNNNGMGGKDCVLRTICESANSPISAKSGLLGELLHIFLTPSSSEDKISNEEHKDYVEAEKYGRDQEGSCDEKYPDCDRSLLDVITTFENPFESLFRSYA